MYLMRIQAKRLLLLSSLFVVLVQGPAGARSPRCHRIISLLPSATDTLFALGAGRVVVGVTRYDSHKSLPKVGGIVDASRERILALRPDCIVGPRTLISRLSLPDVVAIPVDYSSLKGVLNAFIKLGKSTGTTEKARSTVLHIKSSLIRLHKLSESLPHPPTLIVVSISPLYVAGPNSFLGELLNFVGAKNVVKKGTFPLWSYEEVLGAGPDVVICLSDHVQKIPKEVLDWSIPAVRTGRVFVLSELDLLRPGPRIVRAALTLYTVIHGPIADE